MKSTSRTAERTVLVVDDEAAIRLLVEASLGGAGCTVIGAGDGPSALRSARQRRPDLILLDLGLPGMPGSQVAQTLRSEAATADVPIVYLTGREPEEVGSVDGVILKPFTPATLRDQLGRWLA